MTDIVVKNLILVELLRPLLKPGLEKTILQLKYCLKYCFLTDRHLKVQPFIYLKKKQFFANPVPQTFSIALSKRLVCQCNRV